MTSSWTWTYQDVDGKPVDDASLTTSEFPSKGDAESFLGEQWQAIADVGVESVTLLEDGDVVYGPMSLRAAE